MRKRAQLKGGSRQGGLRTVAAVALAAIADAVQLPLPLLLLLLLPLLPGRAPVLPGMAAPHSV